MRKPWSRCGVWWIIPAAVLAVVPPHVLALNHFDPPKRMVWAAWVFLMAWLPARELSPALSRVRLGALLLAGWMIVRTLWVPFPGAAYDVLAAWVLPLVLFAVALGMPRMGLEQVMAWTLRITGAGLAALMLAQYAGWDPWYSATTSGMAYRPGRMIGTIGFQNQAADILALCILGSGWWLGQHRRWLWAVLVMLLAVVCTANRGALIALTVSGVVAAAFYAWSSRRCTWAAAGAIALLLGGAVACALLFPHTRDRLEEVLSKGSRSPAVATRLTMTRVAYDLWQEKPWLGWGAGEYARQYLSRLATMQPAEKDHLQLRGLVYAREAHQDYAQLAAEFGVIGLLFMAIFAAEVARTLWRARRQDPGATAAGFGLMVYLGTSMLVTFIWQTAGPGPLAFVLLAWSLRDDPPTRATSGALKRQRWEAGWARAMATGLVCISGVELVLNQWVPHQLSVHPQSLARRLPDWAYRYQALAGAALAREGAWQESLATLQNARHGFQDPILLQNLGHVLVKLGRLDDAVEVYRFWCHTGLEHALALQNLSTAQEQAGQWSESADTLQRSLRLWPQRSDREEVRLAVMYTRAGRPDQVVRWLEPRSDRSPELDNLLGVAYLAMGHHGQAEKAFREALEKNPDLESARRNLTALDQDQPHTP